MDHLILPQSLLLHVFLWAALGTLGVASVALRAHSRGRLRDRAVARDAHALALEFARHLSGASHGDDLRRAATAASPARFWTALESFTDNVGGEEWDRISRELHELPVVRREIGMLEHLSGTRRALAARHLGLLDVPQTRPALRSAMERGPEIVTLTAALSLARLRDRPTLAWLLEHPQRTARYGRFQLVALIKRFGPDAHDELRRLARTGLTEAPIHLASVEVLGLRRDLRSRRILEALMLSPSVEARIVATRAVGRIGSMRSLPALQGALADPAWQVRAQAGRALGEIGVGSSAPRLSPCLTDASWWVRRNAGYALAELGEEGREVLASLAVGSPDRFAREMAQEVLQAVEWDTESPGGVARAE
jgi:HEAT repeat protein